MPALSTLKVGDVEAFTAVLSGNGSGKPVTAIWTADNDVVLTVDSNGKVTARAAGSASVTAKSGDQSDWYWPTSSGELSQGSLAWLGL